MRGKQQARAAVSALLSVVVVVGLVAPAPAGAAGTEVVRQLTVDGWFGGNEGPGGSIGTVELLPGPAGSLGAGSAKLTVDDTGRASLGTNRYRGTRLDAISTLRFSAYDPTAGASGRAVIGFDLDTDTTAADTGYEGRLVFIPSAPPAGTWVQLDALAGEWYATRSPASQTCSQADPCTWAEVLAAWPDAGIRDDALAGGALLLRLGGPVAGGATVFVDALEIGVNGDVTTYDFEPGASITPTVGAAGTVVTMKAFGFKPGVKVRAYYDPQQPRKRQVICQAVADATGAAACTGAIPAGAKAGPIGVHDVTVRGRKGGYRLVYDLSFLLVP